jgi:hypothetical protein
LFCYHDPLEPPPPKEPPPPENPPPLHELLLPDDQLLPLPPVYHQLLPPLPDFQPNIFDKIGIPKMKKNIAKNINAGKGIQHIENSESLSVCSSAAYSPFVALIIASTPEFMPS